MRAAELGARAASRSATQGLHHRHRHGRQGRPPGLREEARDVAGVGLARVGAAPALQPEGNQGLVAVRPAVVGRAADGGLAVRYPWVVSQSIRESSTDYIDKVAYEYRLDQPKTGLQPARACGWFLPQWAGRHTAVTWSLFGNIRVPMSHLLKVSNPVSLFCSWSCCWRAASCRRPIPRRAQAHLSLHPHPRPPHGHQTQSA